MSSKPTAQPLQGARHESDPIALEAYRVARETRNFEITLFWQRSNYFLVLSTAVAAGFFSLKDSKYSLPLAGFGFFVSVLWIAVNLGSKFWQVRWEYRLKVVEEQVRGGMNLFSASWDKVQEDVKKGLNFRQRGPIYRGYSRLVLLKPSVTLMMTFLSALFGVFWTIVIFLLLH